MKHRDEKRLSSALSALDAITRERDSLQRLDLVRRAREATERLERGFVEMARADGYTWAEIGDLYGMTKQGAQQRFSAIEK